jgi:tRNA pseudouridine38-40 synthase
LHLETPGNIDVRNHVRHIRLVVEYDGTTLSGWQRQLNGPTVQAHLEDALANMLAHPVTIIGASRTDAGVHARGQVALLRTERNIPVDGIRRGTNAQLPDTIAIREATEVDESFHPRFSATGKHYRYTVITYRDRSPRWRDRAWHRGDVPLDEAAMLEASRALIGTHDFAAFRAAGCSSPTTRRRIDAIELSHPEPDVLVIDVRGTAFLRNMVRIMVGTLVDVGIGKLAAGQVAEIVASCDRTRAGVTAPAHGLELVEVFYDGIRDGTRSPPPLPASDV